MCWLLGPSKLLPSSLRSRYSALTFLVKASSDCNICMCLCVCACNSQAKFSINKDVSKYCQAPTLPELETVRYRHWMLSLIQISSTEVSVPMGQVLLREGRHGWPLKVSAILLWDIFVAILVWETWIRLSPEKHYCIWQLHIYHAIILSAIKKYV